MNIVRKAAMLLLIALPMTLALPAFAHPGQGAGTGQASSRAEQRLADLKAKLEDAAH